MFAHCAKCWSGSTFFNATGAWWFCPIWDMSSDLYSLLATDGQGGICGAGVVHQNSCQPLISMCSKSICVFSQSRRMKRMIIGLMHVAWRMKEPRETTLREHVRLKPIPGNACAPAVSEMFEWCSVVLNDVTSSGQKWKQRWSPRTDHGFVPWTLWAIRSAVCSDNFRVGHKSLSWYFSGINRILFQCFWLPVFSKKETKPTFCFPWLLCLGSGSQLWLSGQEPWHFHPDLSPTHAGKQCRTQAERNVIRAVLSESQAVGSYSSWVVGFIFTFCGQFLSEMGIFFQCSITPCRNGNLDPSPFLRFHVLSCATNDRTKLIGMAQSPHFCVERRETFALATRWKHVGNCKTRKLRQDTSLPGGCGWQTLSSLRASDKLNTSLW